MSERVKPPAAQTPPMRSGASAGSSVRLAAISSEAMAMSDQLRPPPEARSLMTNAAAAPP